MENELKIVFYLTVNSKKAKENHPVENMHVKTVLLMVESLGKRQKLRLERKTESQMMTVRGPENHGVPATQDTGNRKGKE